MGLLQNGYRDASAGVRIFGATASNNAYPYTLPANTDKTGTKRNIFTAEGYSPKSGIPSGHLHPSSWMLPQVAGGLSSHSEAIGVASWSGSIAAGRNIAGTFDGAAAFEGTGQLVVSGVGSFAGVAAFEGNVTAALNAVGTFAGVASFSGSVVAYGNILGTFAGVASFEAVRYATGSMSGSFAPAITLEAQGFSSYLLDSEDVETGLTLRQALRLVTAATAGKISGGGTSTITIRNAVVDGVDRITATVDTDGNRTAITYDLD
jgi:hypothetical protein